MIGFNAIGGAICLYVLLFLTGNSTAFAASASSAVPDTGAEMSLADCIRVAVRENRTIKSAYLDRIAQKYELRVAEDIFTPKMTVAADLQYSKSSADSSETAGAGFASTVTELFPTGASAVLAAQHDYATTKSAGAMRSYGWSAALTQPLLKGGGIEVAIAPVRTARLNEQCNILALEAVVMDTLTSVITAYRNYVQAVKALEINRQSLERGRELVAINRELIAAGRMARTDIVQSEADVANREFNLLASENNVEAARLDLVKALDIDEHTQITPRMSFEIGPVPCDAEQAKIVAFAHRPDYRSALLKLEALKINAMAAKNGTLWDLSLNAAYGREYSRGGSWWTNGDRENWTAGMRLVIPFWDLTVEQGYVNARVSLEKGKLDLDKLKLQIEIEVRDAVRNAETRLRQVRLAGLSRELTRKKFEIETEKLKAGRSTNFQLVSFQNDLVTAENNELDSIISYLNALTSLERTLGITLDKWGVSIDERKGGQSHEAWK